TVHQAPAACCLEAADAIASNGHRNPAPGQPGPTAPAPAALTIAFSAWLRVHRRRLGEPVEESPGQGYWRLVRELTAMRAPPATDAGRQFLPPAWKHTYRWCPRPPSLKRPDVRHLSYPKEQCKAPATGRPF